VTYPPQDQPPILEFVPAPTALEPRRFHIGDLSSVALIAVVVVVLGLLATSWAFDAIATDLHAQNAVVRGAESPSRTAWGMALSAQLASDVASDALAQRAQRFADHADRLLELAGVVALAGLLLALFSGDGSAAEPMGKVDSRPLASTSNNGNV
jgi:hypothetical protein